MLAPHNQNTHLAILTIGYAILRIGALMAAAYFSPVNFVRQKTLDRLPANVPPRDEARALSVDIDPRFDIV